MLRSRPNPATLCLALPLLALVAPVARGADTPPPPTGDVIELPKFEVTDTRVLPPVESWHYAAIPGFEIISNISERETKRFVNDFLLLQEAITVLMPSLNQADVAVPTSLILCGRGDRFGRFLPDDRGDDLYRTNSLFFDDPERGAIVVDFALSELQLVDNTTIEADPYRGFYKEYFRHLIRHSLGRKPQPWFEEGLVEMFSAIDFNKKWITFAQIGDGFGGGKDSDFNRIFNRTDENGNTLGHALMPLPEMFAREAITTDRFWSAQCYAFVHMCLYGRNQRYQKPFLQFLTRIGTEPPSEEVFIQCFKKNFKEMGLELRGYIDFTDHKYVQFEAKKGQALPDPPPVTLRDATDAESGRIAGEALRLSAHGEAAHLALIAPYIRGARDPQLLAALGLDERLAGNNDRAKKFLEAAMQAKATRPRAYLELARLRYAALKGEAWGEQGLTPAQVADVLAPLKIACTQPPPMAEVYELIAEIWTRSAKPPTREELKIVNQGVMTFSRRGLLLARAADLNLHHGDPEDARKIVEFGLRALPNSPARLALEQIREDLPPPPPPTTLTPGAGTPAAPAKSAPAKNAPAAKKP